MIFQTIDVEQRLKNLQRDYSELQNTHDRLERAGEDRECELRSEMTRLLEEQENCEQERIEGEERVRKLETKVAEMEKCMKEPEIPRNKISEVRLVYTHHNLRKACLFCRIKCHRS